MNIVCLDGVIRDWLRPEYKMGAIACRISDIPNGSYFAYAEGYKSPFHMKNNSFDSLSQRMYQCTVTGTKFASNSRPWSQIYLLCNYGPRNLDGS